MAVTTYSAHAVARDASKAAGRTVTDKQVRGLARATFARFDKDKHPAYQSHAYTAAERKRLLDLFAARARGRSTATASKPRASKPRASKPAAAVTPDA